MKYSLLRTDRANDQLRDIVFYMEEDSGSVDIALNYLDELENAINNLSDFPCIGAIPKYTILKRQGYRVLIIEKHLVFYKVQEKERVVIIYAVVDGRREYRNLI